MKTIVLAALTLALTLVCQSANAQYVTGGSPYNAVYFTNSYLEGDEIALKDQFVKFPKWKRVLSREQFKRPSKPFNGNIKILLAKEQLKYGPELYREDIETYGVNDFWATREEAFLTLIWKLWWYIVYRIELCTPCCTLRAITLTR